MEDQLSDTSGSVHGQGSNQQGSDRSEPVRSRWSPKPEQILILESIFNSGMVNPPKDETVRIRKMLEKFGSVGDANVFYWFQNRRSRSRRRQRQMAAGDRRIPATNKASDGVQIDHGAAIYYDPTPFPPPPPPSTFSSCSSSSAAAILGGGFATSPACDDSVDHLFSISQNLGFPVMEPADLVPPILCPSDSSDMQYQPGLITVFINGVASEIPKGPLDLRSMFGENAILVHSSGEPVHVNEYGISLQSLQLGENYFLVSRSS